MAKVRMAAVGVVAVVLRLTLIAIGVAGAGLPQAAPVPQARPQVLPALMPDIRGEVTVGRTTKAFHGVDGGWGSDVFSEDVSYDSMTYFDNLSQYVGVDVSKAGDLLEVWRMQGRPFISMAEVARVKFLDFSEREAAILRDNDQCFHPASGVECKICPNPSEECRLRKANVVFRSDSHRKPLSGVFLAVGRGSVRVEGEYTVPDCGGPCGATVPLQEPKRVFFATGATKLIVMK